MKTLYFSIPVTLDWNTVTGAIYQLNKKFHTTFWNRKNNSYQNDLIRKCDGFVVFFPNNKWKYEVDELPSGVKRELRQALALNKPIYLAYKNSSGEYQFYHTNAMPGDEFDEDDDDLTGMPGTSGRIYDDFKTEEKVVIYNEYPVGIGKTGTLKIFPSQKKKDVHEFDNSLSDVRLLLLL